MRKGVHGERVKLALGSAEALFNPSPDGPPPARRVQRKGEGSSRLPGCTWMEIETFPNVLTQLAGELEGI